MHIINVGNLKTTKAGEICDRSSILGNPFVMSTKTNAEREKVVAAYRKYIAILNQLPDQIGLKALHSNELILNLT